MKIIKITLENFKSFQGKHTLSFEQKVPGLYYIGGDNQVENLGSNGAGKTTIWEAWEWCWYGRTHRDLKAGGIEPWFLGSVVSAVTVVWEQFGVRYTLQRQRNPIKLLLEIESGNPEGEVGPQLVDQKRVQEVLNLSMTEFTHLLLLGQSVPLFFDLTPAQKMEVLQDISNLTEWVDRGKQADSAAKQVQRDQDETARQVVRAETQIEEIEGQIEDAISVLQGAKARQQQRELKLQNRIDDLTSLQKNTNTDIAAFEKTHTKATQDCIRFEVIVARSVKALADQVQTHAARLTMMDQKEAELETLEAAMKKFDQLGTGSCPTCWQDIDASHKQVCEADWKVQIEELTQQWNELEDEVHDLLIVKQQKQALLYHEQEKMNGLSDSADEIQRKIDRAVAAQLQYKNERRLVEQELTDQEDGTSELNQVLAKKKARKIETVASLKVLCKKGDALEQEYEATKYWVKGFRDIRLMLLDESLVLLQAEVNNALQDLGMLQWRIEFDVEREKNDGGITKGFQVLIYPPGVDKPIPWESYSSGESQRLRLAGRLGIASLITSRKGIVPSVEIYDEPTAGLSQEGIADVMQLLQRRAETLQRAIYIVDHRTLDLTVFQETLLVVKDETGSHFVASPKGGL